MKKYFSQKSAVQIELDRKNYCIIHVLHVHAEYSTCIASVGTERKEQLDLMYI